MTTRSRISLGLIALTVAAALLAASAQAAVRPQLSFTSKPAAVSPIAKPTFKISHSVALKSQTCRIDTAAFKACGASWTSPGALKVGKHTAQVAAVTKTGKKLTIAYTWTIDTPPPAPALHGVTPYNWVLGASRTVGVTDAATDIGHYVYQLDGGPEQTLNPGGTIVITKQGTTQLSVVAVDKRGQASTPATGLVKLDSAAPDIRVTLSASTPAHLSLTPVVTDTASGVASVSWAYSADGGASWSAAQTAATITVPHDGDYQIRVTATDNAGNTNAQTFSAQQSSVAPIISIDPDHNYLSPWNWRIKFPVSADDQFGVTTLTYRTRLIGGTWSSAADRLQRSNWRLQQRLHPAGRHAPRRL